MLLTLIEVESQKHFSQFIFILRVGKKIIRIVKDVRRVLIKKILETGKDTR